MHVHIINELYVVSGPAEDTDLQERVWKPCATNKRRLISRTYDRQWRKRKSTVLYYPRSTTEVQLYVPPVLEHPPWLSRRRDPCPNSRRHVARDDTKTYVCIYIYMVCACAECQTVCNVATSDACRAPCRHVWRVGFPCAPLAVCGVAKPDCCSVVQSCDCSIAKHTVPMLSTLMFRLSVSLKNWIIHRRRVCIYILSTTEGARRVMQV